MYRYSAFEMRDIETGKREKCEAFIINDEIKLLGVHCKKSISNSWHMLYIYLYMARSVSNKVSFEKTGLIRVEFR